MGLNQGIRRGTGNLPHHPTTQKSSDDGGVFVADSSKNGQARVLTPSPTDPVQPLGTFMYQRAGEYVGKRALDKWKYTTGGVKTVVVVGDSLTQAATKGADGWPERLARVLGDKYGPRLTAGAGYYGLYRSGGTGPFTNTDREWYVNGAWVQAAVGDAWNLAPYTSGLQSPSTAVRTVTDGTTTINSRSVVSATIAFVTGDIGSLITGTNIPPNTYIVAITSATQAEMSQPASASATTTATLNIYKNILVWTRPVGANSIATQVYDAATTISDATLTSNTANFKTMHVGAYITGTGISEGTTIASITSDSEVEMSAVALSTNTGGLLTIHEGRSVNDNVTTISDPTITSATAAFTSDDVGCRVRGTGISDGTYILRVTSATTAVMSQNAASGGSSRFLHITDERAMRHAFRDMAATANSTTITSATAAFTSADVNKHVTGTFIPNNTYIVSVTSATGVVLNNIMPFTTTGGILTIGSTSAQEVQELGLMWANNISGSGATFIYSTTGGDQWTQVTQSSTGTARIDINRINATNPTSLIVAANVSNAASAAGAITQQLGVTVSQYASDSPTGFALYNIAKDGETITNLTTGGVGDPLAILDGAGRGGTFTGLDPDLIIALYTNDMTAYDQRRYWNAINKLISRVDDYADILFLSTYDQSSSGVFGRSSTLQRLFAKVLKDAALKTTQPYWYAADGTVNSGSATITSSTIYFHQSDIGKSIQGDGIQAGTTITAVASLTSATMSLTASATFTGNCTFRILGDIVDTGNAVLDLYEAWKAYGIQDWNDASAEGLMYDTLHQNQIGHNDMARRVLGILETYS
ncbi:hydrolase [Caudoviricetes sp.]|nr:hydrolase [Caudoviricetes sp.]